MLKIANRDYDNITTISDEGRNVRFVSGADIGAGLGKSETTMVVNVAVHLTLSSRASKQPQIN